MSLVERLTKAIWIAWGNEWPPKAPLSISIPDANARLADEAVLEALGFVTCQTCAGSGNRNRIPNAQYGGPWACPDCRLGVVPSEAMIKRAVTEFRKAQTDSTVMLPKFVYDGMRAALLEAFGGDA